MSALEQAIRKAGLDPKDFSDVPLIEHCLSPKCPFFYTGHVRVFRESGEGNSVDISYEYYLVLLDGLRNALA
jgi:hypothetical protein